VKFLHLLTFKSVDFPKRIRPNFTNLEKKKIKTGAGSVGNGATSIRALTPNTEKEKMTKGLNDQRFLEIKFRALTR
jgi:hypothetical protein